MELVSVILLGPVAAFVLLGLIAPLRRSGRPAAWVAISGITTSLIASIVLLLRYRVRMVPESAEFIWAPLSSVPSIRFGLLIDGLSVPMLALVCLVALLVQIYSLAYMGQERPAAFGRYFTYHSLFAAAMLGLVASHNTLQTYFFWELVGLGSYLLIGFWYEKPVASRAAMKAFWVTRLGDVGFALGLIFLWSVGGSFVFSELFEQAAAGQLAGPMLTLGVAGLFLGAMGKSAQFPLHIWLPDAMEGPTPVSALIHAATMVAAGVYLMARITPLLQYTPHVAAWVLTIGTLTAFLAATMALVARDVKRILAFSTISQLGYMMAAIGAASTVAAIYHLSMHAFFKALLFLAAGSLIHAVHTNDIFEMGRLSRKMPLTMLYFLIGGLALSGLPPLSGYFSKGAILSDLLHGGHAIAFWVLLITAGLTSFYMARAFFVIFFTDRDGPEDAHESPPLMTVPMGLLAVLTLLGGILAPAFAELIGHSISVGPQHAAEGHSLLVPVAKTSVAVLGIVIAWLGYQRRAFRPAAVAAAAGPLTTLLERRYFIDDLFLALYRLLYVGLGRLVGWFDRYVIDGLVNLIGWLTWQLAGYARRIQTGRAQDALYAIAVGFLLLALLALRG